MSADWQVGDCALCVNNGPMVSSRGNVRFTPELHIGAIYTVSAVGTGLKLAELPDKEFHPDSRIKWLGYNRKRFIKVTPPAADEFDTEVIELLNRKPVEA